MSTPKGEINLQPRAPHPYWRGSVDDLRSASEESLLVAPLFVVDHEPYRRHFHERQATARTKEVGLSVARIFGGTYRLETRGHNFKSANSEHIDGVVDPYLQIHTTYFADRDLQIAPIQGATRFIMRRYLLPNGLLVGDVIPKKPSHSLEREYVDSKRIQHVEQPYVDTSFANMMKTVGHQLPAAKTVFVIDVPIGSTAVFLNGFGYGNEILSHETKSVRADGSLATFQRVASLGRVVVPGGVAATS